MCTNAPAQIVDSLMEAFPDAVTGALSTGDGSEKSWQGNVLHILLSSPQVFGAALVKQVLKQSLLLDSSVISQADTFGLTATSLLFLSAPSILPDVSSSEGQGLLSAVADADPEGCAQLWRQLGLVTKASKGQFGHFEQKTSLKAVIDVVVAADSLFTQMQEGPWTKATAQDVEQNASCAKVLVNGEFLLWWALFYACPADIVMCLLKHNPEAASLPRPCSAEPLFLALASGHSLVVFDALLALVQPQQALRASLDRSLQLLAQLGHTGVAQQLGHAAILLQPLAGKTRGATASQAGHLADAGLLHVCLRIGTPEALLERLVEMRPDLVTSTTLLEVLERPFGSVKSVKLWRRLAELEPSGKLVALRALQRTLGTPLAEHAAQAPQPHHACDAWEATDPWQTSPVPGMQVVTPLFRCAGHTGESSPVSQEARSAFLAEFGWTTSYEQESQMEMLASLEEELDRGPSARPAQVRRLLQKLAGAAQQPIAAKRSPGSGGQGGMGSNGKGGKGQSQSPVYAAQMAALLSCPAAVTRILFAQWPDVARCPIPAEHFPRRLDRSHLGHLVPTYLSHILIYDVKRSLQTSRHGLGTEVDKELVLAAEEVVMFAPDLVEASACAELLECCNSDETWLAMKQFWLGMWHIVEATETVSESCFKALDTTGLRNKLQLFRDALPSICRKNPGWLVEGAKPRAWLCRLLAEARRHKQEALLPKRDWVRERLLHMARNNAGNPFSRLPAQAIVRVASCLGTPSLLAVVVSALSASRCWSASEVSVNHAMPQLYVPDVYGYVGNGFGRLSTADCATQVLQVCLGEAAEAFDPWAVREVMCVSPDSARKILQVSSGVSPSSGAVRMLPLSAILINTEIHAFQLAEWVLSLFPEAACAEDGLGRLPLELLALHRNLAIDSRRSWQSLLEKLLPLTPPSPAPVEVAKNPGSWHQVSCRSGRKAWLLQRCLLSAEFVHQLGQARAAPTVDSAEPQASGEFCLVVHQEYQEHDGRPRDDAVLGCRASLIPICDVDVNLTMQHATSKLPLKQPSTLVCCVSCRMIPVEILRALLHRRRGELDVEVLTALLLKRASPRRSRRIWGAAAGSKHCPWSWQSTGKAPGKSPQLSWRRTPAAS
ncbi:unnamed protein product [Symbiodinium sp. CCMP2456]|nr:unnamed protein product [Symbiodinium sp. CCMP2456]